MGPSFEESGDVIHRHKMLLERTYGRKVVVLFRITVMVLTGKTVLFVRAGEWKVDGSFKNTVIALAGKTTLLVRTGGYKIDVSFTYTVIVLTVKTTVSVRTGGRVHLYVKGRVPVAGQVRRRSEPWCLSMSVSLAPRRVGGTSSEIYRL